jgi:hypothetical protein
MKEVKLWRWYVWNNQRTKKVATRYVMDEETALARDPEAERVPNSLESRMVPESEAEHHLTSQPVRMRGPE